MPLISRVPTPSTESDTLSIERTVFNVLLFLGLFLNVAVLLPALFSSKVHRRNAWYNVLISWMIYSLSYLLILGYQHEHEPPFGICLAQAALVYSCPTLCALTLVCLLLDYYILASALTFEKDANPLVLKLLLLFPWIAFGFVGYIVLMLIANPLAVTRNPVHFYCSINTNVPALFSAIVIFVASIVVLVVEACTAVILYRHWGVFIRPSLDKPYLSFSMFVRLSLFNIMILVADGLDVTVIKNPGKDSTAGWTIVMATIPILAALTFGTQRDILSVYMFWRRWEDN
ncbi:hypothetical protein E4T56_gene7965 [Termitomyces sp. T112]|nr:hypothetical protein E4T56_gene7965 [Termitomyces sp. T112]KAH0578375.1 hypothetical protein H2248_003987 [Termitomyces sp. 'cryptogamus']